MRKAPVLRCDCWNDLDHASRAAADRILAAMPSRHFDRLEILRHVFYRGRGAYLVGRIVVTGQGDAARASACAIQARAD